MTALSSYTALVTSEHQPRPRFMATVAAVMQPFVDIQNTLLAVSGDYDLDVAVGTQLDAVGLWVGASRWVAISVSEYFSFDTKGLGWDQGVWFQTGDSLSTVTTLDDGHYRLLIRAKIACNSWDGSQPAAHAILTALVAGDGGVVTGTEGTKSVAWSIAGPVSAVTQAILLGGYVPLKPVGITVSYTFPG